MKISAVPLVLATFFSSACALEQRFIFHPAETLLQTPADVGLTFDDVYFATADGVRLNGWYIPHPDAGITLLWFHGNAGNISHRVQNIRLLHDKLGINIFIFDYRGYGRSEGSISERGTYRDGAAAAEFLRERYHVQPSQLVFFGRSLGAAVAAETAISFDNLILILESPFVSVPEMARAIFPLLPLRLLLSTQYNILEKMQRVKSPVFVLHGEQDEVVPFTQGRKVFAAAAEPKRFYAIAGAGHNDTYVAGGDRYFSALREAIEWGVGWRSKPGGAPGQTATGNMSR
jgi:fermentation-respiration switch protein FrsA (DUF1100 family)